MPQPIADFFSQVYALVLAHAWLALSALAIGGAIRVLKSDTPLPTLPAKYRAYAALVFGLASGIVQAIMGGAPWLLALLQGLCAGGAAIVGHQVLIEGARDGKELFSKSPDVAAASSAAKIAGSIPLFTFAFCACLAARTVIHDATGAVCEVVLQDVVHTDNPQICTTASEVEQTIADWVAAHLSADKSMPAPKPGAHDVYLAVAAKHGVTVK